MYVFAIMFDFSTVPVTGVICSDASLTWDAGWAHGSGGCRTELGWAVLGWAGLAGERVRSGPSISPLSVFCGLAWRLTEPESPREGTPPAADRTRGGVRWTGNKDF